VTATGTGLADSVRGWLARPAVRRGLALGCAALAALAAAFFLGASRAAWDAGGDVEKRHLRRQVDLLETENRQVSEQLARLQTDQRVDREAYAQIEGQLSELQGKIIEQQEELAFYRGVVGGPGEGGLQVRDLSVTPADGGAFRLRFTLAHVRQAEREVRGQLQVRLEGTRAGRPASVDVAGLMRNRPKLAFAFRYFQEIALDVEVPADLRPERVVVRILPTTQGVKASVESFPWSGGAG
jgi:hypothetical protein